MQYVFYILLVAVLFGLVALGDLLLKPKPKPSGCPGTASFWAC